MAITTTIPLVAAIAAAAALSGCGGTAPAGSGSAGTTPIAAPITRDLPQADEPSQIDPKNFSTNITNPYWPMSPGSRWEFAETDTTGTKESTVVTVTAETKTLASGVVARVIRDVVSEDGVPVEITLDWYAQDTKGNIWYFGEAVENYENGKLVDRKGSFEAGVNGAQPGILMPANPEPGLAYRQEYLKGEAEDRAAVVTVGQEQVEVPFGYFNKNVLMTRDLVPTEPKVQELKFYVPDVGPVLSVHTDGKGGRAELVKYTPGK